MWYFKHLIFLDGVMVSPDTIPWSSSVCLRVQCNYTTKQGWSGGEIRCPFRTAEELQECLWMLREGILLGLNFCGWMIWSQVWLPGLLGRWYLGGVPCTLLPLWCSGFSRDHGCLLIAHPLHSPFHVTPTKEEKWHATQGAWAWPVMNTNAFKLGRSQQPCLFDLK